MLVQQMSQKLNDSFVGNQSMVLLAPPRLLDIMRHNGDSSYIKSPVTHQPVPKDLTFGYFLNILNSFMPRIITYANPNGWGSGLPAKP